MPTRLVILLLLLLPLRAAEMVLSQSQQFAVYAPKAPVITERVPEGSILVEPQLLVVTAERIKQALGLEISALKGGGRRIHMHIMDRAAPDSDIGIFTTRFTDGWNYRMAIPPVVNELRLLKGLIQVILVEYANRSGDKGADMPGWIVEGLCQQLYFSVGPKLVVDRAPVGWEGTMRSLQGRMLESMRTNPPPSFDDLTTLAPPPPGAPAELYYQSSARLLVRALLQMPDGRKRFGAFLQQLAHTWNWQTAFRQSFHFERMLDVEKWWALVTVEFNGRDTRQAWSRGPSLEKLDALLKTRVEVRGQANALPQIREVDLLTLLRDGDWPFQRAALKEKAGQLSSTAPHLAPQISGLALEYKSALESYLNKREKGVVSPTLRMPAAAYYQTLAAEILRNVEALDAKRRALVEPAVSAR